MFGEFSLEPLPPIQDVDGGTRPRTQEGRGGSKSATSWVRIRGPRGAEGGGKVGDESGSTPLPAGPYHRGWGDGWLFPLPPPSSLHQGRAASSHPQKEARATRRDTQRGEEDLNPPPCVPAGILGPPLLALRCQETLIGPPGTGTSRPRRAILRGNLTRTHALVGPCRAPRGPAPKA